MAQYIPLNANDDLDAINDMLAAIGEPAVLQLDEGNADVSNAQRILHRVNRQVQAKGWNFNINEAAVLTPDVQDNKIRFLPSYLRVMTAGATSYYSNMGGYLYDLSTQSTTFTDPITVELVEMKPFSECNTQILKNTRTEQDKHQHCKNDRYYAVLKIAS